MDGIETGTNDSAARRATVRRDRSADRTTPPDETATIRELELKVLALRDHVIGCEAKLGELRADLERERARSARSRELFEIRIAHASNERAVRDDLEKQLDDMRASTTWRVGRMLVKPVHALRSAFRPS